MTPFTPTQISPPHHRVLWLGALLAALAAFAALALVAARDLANDRTTTSTGLAGSGALASERRSVPPFTAVTLAGANSVAVNVGGRRSVVVHGDDNLVPHVTTAVRGGALVIGADHSFRTRAPMSVEVTAPALDAVKLLGSGELTVAGVHAATFTAALPGSGTLRVTGTTVRLDARLTGSGVLSLEGLVARNATAVVAGTGRLAVHATRSLDARVSGTGEIVYRGDPASVSMHVRGTGAVMPEWGE